MNLSAFGADVDGGLTRMHPAARNRTHGLRRIMERVPGICPGVFLRLIDETVNQYPPLVTLGGEAIYRVTTPDGRTFCVITVPLIGHTITVMAIPCKAHVGNRVYLVGDATIEKVKNENATFRDNKWRQFRQKRQARERFL